MRTRTLFAAPVLVLLVACSDNKVNAIHKTETFEQAPSNEVDILWVLDNSVSMVQEQTAVAGGAAAFISNLETTGMDFHIGVITSDLDPTNMNAAALVGPYVTNTTPNYQAEFAAQVQVGTGGDDQEKGIEAAYKALIPPRSTTTNVGFLRSEASLAIVVVSDENDCSDDGALGSESNGESCYTDYDKLTPIPDLVSQLKEVKKGSDGTFTFSGIIGPDAVDGCADAVPGKRYATIIEMIGGVRANICDADYTAIMDSLGLIAAGTLDTFSLGYLAEPETIEVSVDDIDGNQVVASETPGETDGWTYEEAADQTYAHIVFHGAAVPPRGATIAVDYTFAGNLETAVDTGG